MMNSRYEINKKNSIQLLYILKSSILAENTTVVLDLTLKMYQKGLAQEIYQVCVEVYLYYCCIYLPDYIDLLLSYEQSLTYYYKLVYHLLFSPKKYIFHCYPEHKDMYFYLQDQQQSTGVSENNHAEIEKYFDIYYNTIQYYIANINITYQDSINYEFSHLLYYLSFHEQYDTCIKNIWAGQFHIFTNTQLLDYIRKLQVLEDYLSCKKLKLLVLYYTLQFRFLDIPSVKPIYQENNVIIEELLQNLR